MVKIIRPDVLRSDQVHEKDWLLVKTTVGRDHTKGR